MDVRNSDRVVLGLVGAEDAEEPNVFISRMGWGISVATGGGLITEASSAEEVLPISSLNFPSPITGASLRMAGTAPSLPSEDSSIERVSREFWVSTPST